MERLCAKLGDTECGPLDGGTAVKVLLSQLLGAFFFVNIHINTTYSNGSEDILVNGLTIGCALSLGTMIASPMSGASINPAIGVVQPIL